MIVYWATKLVNFYGKTLCFVKQKAKFAYKNIIFIDKRLKIVLFCEVCGRGFFYPLDAEEVAGIAVSCL